MKFSKFEENINYAPDGAGSSSGDQEENNNKKIILLEEIKNYKAENLGEFKEIINNIEKEYKSKGACWKVRSFNPSENKKFLAYVVDYSKSGYGIRAITDSVAHNEIFLQDLENSQTKHSGANVYNEGQMHYRSKEILSILNVSNDGEVTYRTCNGEIIKISPKQFYPGN